MTKDVRWFFTSGLCYVCGDKPVRVPYDVFNRNEHVFNKLILNCWDNEKLNITQVDHVDFFRVMHRVFGNKPSYRNCRIFFSNEAIQGIYDHGWGHWSYF